MLNALLKTNFKYLFFCAIFIMQSFNPAFSDADGIPDVNESCNGIFLNTTFTGTCATVAECSANVDCVDTLDFDGDGRLDHHELNFERAGIGGIGAPFGVGGSYNNDGDTGTNPVQADSDGDGLSDFNERCTGEFNTLSDRGTCPTVTSCTECVTNGWCTGSCISTLDYDGDGINDNTDNCPLLANPTQLNTDVVINNNPDAFGDVCDDDIDGDGDLNGVDNCQLISNADQLNTDGDSMGNACDSDDDNDGIPDILEDTNSDGNFDTGETNPLLVDTDSDGIEDGIEDADQDGIVDTGETDPRLADTDNDATDDNIDNCPVDSNADQADTNSDGEGDACDNNDDGDALIDVDDACPLTPLAGALVTGTNVDRGCDLICMRPHVGVPGQPAPPTIDGDVVNDVGWSGAHRVTFSNGVVDDHVAFQGLRDKSSAAADAFLYLSFEVKNDVGGASTGDRVVLNFRPSFDATAAPFVAGNASNDIRIIINAETGIPVVSVHNGSMWASVATPTNMVVTMNPSPTTDTWDVEIKMPISNVAAGGSGWHDFEDYFKFYFNVIRTTDATAVTEANSTQFVWPDRGHRVNGDVEDYPYDNFEWGIATKDNSAVCNGVSISSPSKIGTTNTPENSINLTLPNTFFAEVNNLTWDSATSSWAAANNINVRFRIADWGMAVGDSPSWRDIPGTAATPNPTDPQTIPAATASDMPGLQTFNMDWTVPVAEQAMYHPDTGYKHQCILVEINSTSNANITSKSMRRNMNFDETASVFERKAKIDARGLPNPPNGASEHTFILQESRIAFDPIQIKDVDEKNKTHQLAAMRLTRSNKEIDAKKDHVPSRGKDDYISQTQWLVHGYRETGNYVEIDGIKYPLTEPVASFGYVISHTGEKVDEWKYAITGAEKTGDGTYKLKVPKDGFKEIVTRVESVELSLFDKIIKFIKEYLWWILFLLFLLALLYWFKKRND